MKAHTRFLRMVTVACLTLGCCVTFGCKGKVPDPNTPNGDGEPTLSNDPPPERSLEGQAGLIITSSPAGIEVKVDGQSVGNTPVTKEGLDSGEHDVTFMFEGDEQVTLTVRLEVGEFQKVHQSISPDASDAVMGNK